MICVYESLYTNNNYDEIKKKQCKFNILTFPLKQVEPSR